MRFNFPDMLRSAYIFAGMALLVSCQQSENHRMPELPDFDHSYYDHALTVVDEIISREPDNAEAHYRRADLLLQQNKTNNALASVRKALELDNKEPAYHLLGAQAYLKKGQNREAFKAARQALQFGNASLALYEVLAEASMNSNYYSDALIYADSALSLSPDNPHYLFLKGKSLAARKDSLLAEDVFIKSMDRGKPAADVYEALVDMYMNVGNYRKARQYMEKNLDTQPKVSNRMLFQQAQILRRTGNPDSASEILYQINQQPGVNAFALQRELMLLHFERNKHDSTHYYANLMLNVRPNDKLALITKARVWDKKRSYQQAIRTYVDILALDSLQQEEIHKLAESELDYLRGKVAYLWKKQQQEELQKLKKGLAPVQPITPEDEP